jgi:alpha-1,3-rhamnosyl/mannosyltransferase
MRRIAIDCREFREGRITGIGRFLGNFVARASAARPDWEFLLLGAQHTRVPFDFGGNVRLEKMYEANTQFWEQVLLPPVLKRRGCDLFYSPYPKTCLFSRVPSVLTIHDLTWLVYPGYRRIVEPRLPLTRLYARKASAVLADSENSRKDIEKLLGEGGGKTFVCHGSVDAALFRRVEVGNILKARYGLDGDYILYVGNANPHKNLDGLVGAYGALPAELRDKYRLALAGVGNYRPELPGCVVIPAVPDADLPFLYSGAALFVFPSFYEGFGLPPLEAMACGCPVVSSGAPCMPEILGDACLYFDPFSRESITAAIAAALKAPGLRAGLAVKGRERMKLYAPDRTCGEMLRVFEEVMEKCPQERRS